MKIRNMIMAVALVLAANTSANAINTTALVNAAEKHPVIACMAALCLCNGIYRATAPSEKGFAQRLSDGIIATLRPGALLGMCLATGVLAKYAGVQIRDALDETKSGRKFLADLRETIENIKYQLNNS